MFEGIDHHLLYMISKYYVTFPTYSLACTKETSTTTILAKFSIPNLEILEPLSYYSPFSPLVLIEISIQYITYLNNITQQQQQPPEDSSPITIFSQTFRLLASEAIRI
jgi:hypothetical protein